MTRYKKAKRYLVYIIARIFLSFLSLFPLRLSLRIGALIGALAKYVAHKPRNTARKQIQESLAYSPSEADTTVHNLFKNCGLLAVEMACLPKIYKDIQNYVFVEDEDLEAVRRGLSMNRGAVIVSAHIGNWELLAQRMVAANMPSTVLARLNPNPYLGKWIVEQRQKSGLEVIDRQDAKAARRVLAALKKNRIVGFLIDQDTKVKSSFVPFFGREASTPVGAAQFALRNESPTFFMYTFREAKGHRIFVQPVPLEPYLGMHREDGIRLLTAHFTGLIENAVREHPDQWMWFHERWKTQPLPEPAVQGKAQESA